MAVREQFEVVIVGGGPAGLCAALYGGRGMLRTVLLERGVPGGELLNTEWIEDYPGFSSVQGRELAELMTRTPCSSAPRSGRRMPSRSCAGRTARSRSPPHSAPIFEAPAVIITAGGTPMKLRVPGELEYAGRGVSYCAVCDGAFFKGDTIAVVGGGDAAVEEADYLTRYAEKVYLVHRRGELRASRILQERLFRIRRSRWSGTSACWSCSATRPASRPSRSRIPRPDSCPN